MKLSSVKLITLNMWKEHILIFLLESYRRHQLVLSRGIKKGCISTRKDGTSCEDENKLSMTILCYFHHLVVIKGESL
jgi:hypothetical protein